MKTLSIVVPVYNNEANLPVTISALLALAPELSGWRLDLVLVDDGSRDASRSLLLGAVQEHPDQIRTVLLTRNFGQTAAIQAGLRHARGDCVGIISCDLQEPHKLFIEMVRLWTTGAKFVIGERVDRAEAQGHRFVSSIYWRLVRHFAFPDFPTLGYDFCLIDRQVVNDLNQINEKNSSIFVLIYWLGYAPTRLPIRRELRAQGKSQWRFWKKVSFTADTLVGFTYLPARCITFAGLFSAVLCLAYLLVVMGQRIFLGKAPPGWATLAGLQLLLGAMILFSLGILSEYLLRILDEARKRPPFVVDRVLPTSTANPTDAPSSADSHSLPL
jgi:dolichol-phosphate mannosyltransferase